MLSFSLASTLCFEMLRHSMASQAFVDVAKNCV